MYFPILRGRQFELLALRECLEDKVLSKRIIPVIEPVRVSSTYIKTIDTFIKAHHRICVIQNPEVGTWNQEYKKDTSEEVKKKILSQKESEFFVKGWDVNSKTIVVNNREEIPHMLFLCKNVDDLIYYDKNISENNPAYMIVPDKNEFRRRVLKNRIVCEDHFNKKARNVDYQKVLDEFFSADHLYYRDDNNIGFSDYSIIGKDYSETGFAPYAVALHIVYFDSEENLRIAHFVSDSNEDISDPAKKFKEAVEKMVHWNQERGIQTKGINLLERAYREGKYPGLGVIKKYTIMHHMELISQYLEKE